MRYDIVKTGLHSGALAFKIERTAGDQSVEDLTLLRFEIDQDQTYIFKLSSETLMDLASKINSNVM